MSTVRGYQLPSWTMPSSVVLCASYSGNTEETLACYEAAGALGAMRVAVTTGGRLAEAAREDGVPVIPLPAGLQPRAAVAYMIGVGARGRDARRRRAGCAHRDRRGRRRPRAARPRSGARTPTRTASRSGSRSGSTAPACACTGRSDRGGRDPLEDPAEREREDPGVRGRAARGRPQRDRRLAGRAAPLGSFTAIFLEDVRPAPARARSASS